MGIRVPKNRWLWKGLPDGLLRLSFRPSHLKIGVRLTVCFIAIVVLMIASHAFTLWQFDRVRAQEERMHQLDQESQAVLRLHADLLILRNQLDELTAVADFQRFARETTEMRRNFLERTQQADYALRRPAGVAREPTMLSSIETIQSS